MKVISTYYTDIGLVKKTNQDALLIKKAQSNLGQISLAVICDGMGGLAKGEVASASVIKMFNDWFENDLIHLLENQNFSLTDIGNQFQRMIEKKNIKILEYGKQNNINLGTTVTAIFILDNQYIYYHVGDSRLYIINDQITQLTHDQTLVQREYDEGKITYEQLETDPRKSILLQCVGASKIVEPEIKQGTLNVGDLVLLCTDGFRRVLSAQEIHDTLVDKKDVNSLNGGLRQIVQKNKQLGEEDNITGLVLLLERED